MTSSPEKTYSGQVAERIRLERERLGLTQAAFAEMAGIGRATQLFYENHDRFPDIQYLEKLFEHGIDIPFIMTGQRSQSTYNDAEWLHFRHDVLWEIFKASIKITHPEASAEAIESGLGAFKAFCMVYAGRDDDLALLEFRESSQRWGKCA
jgi:transcriptional regulator with XRE-family HTH domain